MGGSTSGVATFDKILHGLLETSFIRKVDHYPLRDVSRLIIFLIPHVPLATILRGRRETFIADVDGQPTVGSVFPSPNVIPRDGSFRAEI